jgi:hypothetical protein
MEGRCMEDKHNKLFVGTVDAFRKRKGWFFGAFLDEPLVRLAQL